MKQNVNLFTDEEKLKIIHEYYSTEISHKELLIKYGIGSFATLYKWIRKFDITKPNEKNPKQLIMSEDQNNSKQKLELESKIKKLESQLAYEQLRSEALNTMIDIAEDKFKISIRKKSGTKQ